FARQWAVEGFQDPSHLAAGRAPGARERRQPGKAAAVGRFSGGRIAQGERLHRRPGAADRTGLICYLSVRAPTARGAGRIAMDNTRKYLAELIGTFALVSSVCGAALFSAPSAGLMTVAFAIGAIVLAMAYALGPISGGHFNPAVTCGLVAAGRFNAGDAIGYIIAQLAGAILAAAVFYFILSGAPAGKWNDFMAASNLYGPG